MLLTVEIHRGPVTTVAPVGDMDADTASAVATALSELIDAGVRRIVVDGTRLDYLSSDGLGCIIQHVQFLRETEGDLKLACFHGKAAIIVELLGLDKIIQVFSSLADAIAAFALPLPSETEALPRFAATKKGKSVHRLTCRFIKGKDTGRLRQFRSLEKAKEAGLARCRICWP